MLMGSFLSMPQRRNENAEFFSAAPCERARLLISPKHSFGSLWITCTHPCLNCSNMLEVDQTERLLERTADRASPVGCWGSDMKTGKEQRLVGTVKDAWTIAAHQNSFSETGMKYPQTARTSQTCQNSTSVSQKIWCQNREILAYDIWSLYFSWYLSSSVNQ